MTRAKLECLQGLLDTTKMERDEALQLFTSLKESLMQASSSLGGANGSITQSIKHYNSSSYYSLSFRNDLSTNRSAVGKHPDSVILDMPHIFASEANNEDWTDFPPEEFDILNEDGGGGSFVEDESLKMRSSGSGSSWETNLQRQSSVISTAASPQVKKNQLHSDGSEKEALMASSYMLTYARCEKGKEASMASSSYMPTYAQCEKEKEASMASSSYMPTYSQCSFLDMPSLVISSLSELLDNPSTPSPLNTSFGKKKSELSFAPFSPPPETPNHSMVMVSGSPNMANKYDIPPPPMVVVSPPNLAKLSTTFTSTSTSIPTNLPLKRSLLETLEGHKTTSEEESLLVTPLPKKGKLLEAVARAGPLLQQLIVIGPLPNWKNPPPVMDIPMMPMSLLSNLSMPSHTCTIMPNPTSPFVDTCQSLHIMHGLPSSYLITDFAYHADHQT